MHSNGGPMHFSAAAHEEMVDAFYDIGRDPSVSAVILTGAGGDWMPSVDFQSFGDVSDPTNWSLANDEARILENIANIRAPMICAVEGRAWVHTEYCLLSNVVIPAHGATLHDAPHFAGGIVPGDGTWTLWSYRAGPARVQAWLLNPSPISAAAARDWGVVASVVPDGMAVEAAIVLAEQLTLKPLLTTRNTRIHFTQPLKERIVAEVGYGLSLEGASAAALVKSLQQ
jgi:enoyl-CoA hydratase/carnithine racemase